MKDLPMCNILSIPIKIAFLENWGKNEKYQWKSSFFSKAADYSCKQGGFNERFQLNLCKIFSILVFNEFYLYNSIYNSKIFC